MIQREVTLDYSGEHTRLACWFWRPAKTNFQKFAALLEIKRTIPNRPDKSVADLLPMKHLPGIKCLLQVEITCANFDHVREDNDE
jgi:hypothetical protein